MQLIRKYDLPFTAVSITYRGSTIEIPQVLVDTGSASTVIAADLVDSIGIFPLPEDRISTIRGVGGSEVVFRRRVDCLQSARRNWPILILKWEAWTMVLKSMGSWGWTS